MPYCQNCKTPVTGDICPLCGQRALPIQNEPKAQQPAKRRKSITAVTGASIIIAIILFIAMVISLLNRPEPPEETPKGSLYYYEDPDIVGRYYGQFQGSVREDKIEIEVFDTSLGETTIMMLDRENFIQISGGLSLSYNDVNNNDKLDGSDILLVNDGASGDRITIMYESTGETIAVTTLT